MMELEALRNFSKHPSVNQLGDEEIESSIRSTEHQLSEHNEIQLSSYNDTGHDSMYFVAPIKQSSLRPHRDR